MTPRHRSSRRAVGKTSRSATRTVTENGADRMKQLIAPTLIVDERRARANIGRMTERALGSGVLLRPHFKTHQSAGVGEWFRDEGVRAITVSSLEMGAYFADHGWDDITAAFPLNPGAIDVASHLARRITLSVAVDSVETAEAVSRRATAPFGVFVEIDYGAGRTGVHASAVSTIEAIVAALAGGLAPFRGLLLYSGDTYRTTSRSEIISIFRRDVAELRGLKEALGDPASEAVLSIGDTPSCSIVEDLGGVDEIRPGNFVFYDLMQERLGACRFDDIAVVLACPVVGVYPERGEFAVHGGAVHLAADHLTYEEGERGYGDVVELTADGWGERVPGARVVRVSQEHGIVACPADLLERIRPGDVVGVVPVHSCHTANAMGVVFDLEGRRYPQKPKNVLAGDGAARYLRGDVSWSTPFDEG